MMDQEAAKLEHSNKTKIFDRQQYLLSSTAGHKPKSHICLGFGQRWNFGQNPKNILISAKIVAPIPAVSDVCLQQQLSACDK